MSFWHSERGAAAVEFALVVPALLALMLGTIEFGRAYNAQISLTHAARETARHMAINGQWVNAMAAGQSASPSLAPDKMAFTADPTTCSSGSIVNIAITYPLDTITGIVDNMTLTGKAAMRCGG